MKVRSTIVTTARANKLCPCYHNQSSFYDANLSLCYRFAATSTFEKQQNRRRHPCHSLLLLLKTQRLRSSVLKYEGCHCHILRRHRQFVRSIECALRLRTCIPLWGYRGCNLDDRADETVSASVKNGHTT